MELLASVKMEWQLSKEQILELHLNLSPMGGNIRGAGLAARTYFGKDVENITLAEAAVLAALPRSPSRLDPRQPSGCKLVLLEKDRILKRMAAQGWISEDQLKVSLGPTVSFRNRPIPIQAPHFVDHVLAPAQRPAHVQNDPRPETCSMGSNRSSSLIGINSEGWELIRWRLSSRRAELGGAGAGGLVKLRRRNIRASTTERSLSVPPVRR